MNVFAKFLLEYAFWIAKQPDSSIYTTVYKLLKLSGVSLSVYFFKPNVPYVYSVYETKYIQCDILCVDIL